MLTKSLNYLTKTLNQHLKTTFSLNEDVALLSNLINADGSLPQHIQNKIIITLISVEENKNLRNTPTFKRYDTDVVYKNAGFSYLVTLLITSNFDAVNYVESLKFLETTIEYFNATPLFNKGNFSDLPQEIEQIMLEVNNVTVGERESVWSTLGVKYQPSIVYKMQLISTT